MKTLRLQGLPPVAGPATRLLVLGSFPGVASLQAQQYYGHPQNHFWKIMQALWPDDPLPAGEHYAKRCIWLLDHGLGLWDVYASCEREGSLDSAIRNAQVNDFAGLRAQCPRLQLIAHNGGESFRHARTVRAALAKEHLPLVRLPSTSPANASWSLERKLEAWREAAVQAGLILRISQRSS
jgi:double-stranded uracil-DNA glycosylase